MTELSKRKLLHKAAGIFPRRSTHGHAIELRSRHADTYRHSLPVFAAGADTFIELQIVSNHRNASQRVGTIADQCRSTNWRGHVAVFNQISLRGGENKLAVRDVHLAPAEVHSINAAFN